MDEDARPTESVFDSIGGQPLARTVGISLGLCSRGTNQRLDVEQVPWAFSDSPTTAGPVQF